MDKSTLKISFRATGPDLYLRIGLNDKVIYQDQPSTEICTISHDFDDIENLAYVLCFELSGKLPEHTTVDEQGQIILDRVIEITDVEFDDIALVHLLTDLAVYHHDTNGTTAQIKERFFGTMGCNGRVEMPFSTPIYLWLLENM